MICTFKFSMQKYQFVNILLNDSEICLFMDTFMYSTLDTAKKVGRKLEKQNHPVASLLNNVTTIW